MGLESRVSTLFSWENHGLGVRRARNVIICENDFSAATSISKAVIERLIKEKSIRRSVVIDNDDDDDVIPPPPFSRLSEPENLHELQEPRNSRPPSADVVDISTNIIVEPVV